MGRHGENIRKRKDGRWEARYIKDYDSQGKAIYRYIYGKTYLEVKEKRKAEQEKNNLKNITSKATFEQLSDDWLNYKKNFVKESTYANYVHIIHKHLIPELGDIYTTSLTSALLEEFLHNKLQSGRLDHKGGLSNKTVADLRSVLKMILNYGQNHNICNLENIYLPIPSGRKPQIHVLTRNDQKKLENYLLHEIVPLHLGVILSLYAGLRIGEVCALQWKDFNFEHGTIHISKTVIRIQNTDPDTKPKTKLIIEKPKTSSSERTIPLPKDILTIFKTNRQNGDIYLLTGTICFMEPRVCLKKYKDLLQKAGIGDYSYHALRHTFATRCVEKNFDIKSLSEIMGHSDVTVTMQRYVHPSFERKKEQMNRLTIMINQSQN